MSPGFCISVACPPGSPYPWLYKTLWREYPNTTSDAFNLTFFLLYDRDCFISLIGFVFFPSISEIFNVLLCCRDNLKSRAAYLGFMSKLCFAFWVHNNSTNGWKNNPLEQQTISATKGTEEQRNYYRRKMFELKTVLTRIPQN